MSWKPPPAPARWALQPSLVHPQYQGYWYHPNPDGTNKGETSRLSLQYAVPFWDGPRAAAGGRIENVASVGTPSTSVPSQLTVTPGPFGGYVGKWDENNTTLDSGVIFPSFGKIRDLDSNFTFAALFKWIYSGDDDNCIISERGNDSNSRARFRVDNATSPSRMEFWLGATGSTLISASPSNVYDGEWTFAAVSHDAGSTIVNHIVVNHDRGFSFNRTDYGDMTSVSGPDGMVIGGNEFWDECQSEIAVAYVWDRSFHPLDLLKLSYDPYGPLRRAPRIRLASGDTITKTHTTDAVLLDQVTKTHTTDAVLLDQVTKTHTTDAVLVEISYQYAYPVSDVVDTNWDTSPTSAQDLYAQLDETVRSDTDYIFYDG